MIPKRIAHAIAAALARTAAIAAMPKTIGGGRTFKLPFTAEQARQRQLESDRKHRASPVYAPVHAPSRQQWRENLKGQPIGKRGC